MPNNDITITKTTVYFWAFNFSEEVEEPVSPSCKQGEGYIATVLKRLKYLVATESDKRLAERLMITGWETREEENEPDWDMLPGGKDYD